MHARLSSLQHLPHHHSKPHLPQARPSGSGTTPRCAGAATVAPCPLQHPPLGPARPQSHEALQTGAPPWRAGPAATAARAHAPPAAAACLGWHERPGPARHAAAACTRPGRQRQWTLPLPPAPAGVVQGRAGFHAEPLQCAHHTTTRPLHAHTIAEARTCSVAVLCSPRPAMASSARGLSNGAQGKHWAWSSTARRAGTRGSNRLPVVRQYKKHSRAQ